MSYIFDKKDIENEKLDYFWLFAFLLLYAILSYIFYLRNDSMLVFCCCTLSYMLYNSKEEVLLLFMFLLFWLSSYLKSTWLKHFLWSPFSCFLQQGFRLLALFVVLEIVLKYYLQTKPNPAWHFFVCLRNLAIVRYWFIGWFWAAIEFACFRWVPAILILWQSGMCESQSTCQTLLFSHCLESLQIQFCF